MDDIVQTARRIATAAHHGQFDKAGVPYISHPERVAARLDQPDAQATGWLHDVLEDTEVTPDDLLAAGIPPRVVEAVKALTHLPDEPRSTYYQRVATNERARTVKLADIADNSDPTRLAHLDEATRTRLEHKYTQARAALQRLE